MDEIGPLGELDPKSAQELLEVQSLMASRAEKPNVEIPVETVDRIIGFLAAWLDNKSPRSGHRPRKSWRDRRWETTAARQVKKRKAELISNGVKAETAEDQAIQEIAPSYFIEPETLRDWTKGKSSARRR